jgi:hypothetical protein
LKALSIAGAVCEKAEMDIKINADGRMLFLNMFKRFYLMDAKRAQRFKQGEATFSKRHGVRLRYRLFRKSRQSSGERLR